MDSYAYVVESPTDKFHYWEFKRREVGDDDVLISIKYCGICHSDIHTARNEWGGTKYPAVPGHEILGSVVKVGKNVTKFKVGDIAGVGCLVDSCGHCDECKDNEEQACENGFSATYNSKEQDKKTPTYGGYSNQITVKESFALKISDKYKDKDLAAVAPLLCAGITTYSPLAAWKDKVVGKQVGIVGLGGLGHAAVKIAAAMGAEVTVFSTTESKKDDALRLGAKHFVVTKDPEQLKKVQGKFGFILNTVSAKHEIAPYLDSLKSRGVLVYVGASPDPLPLPIMKTLFGNKIIAGSLIGGLKQTQEMLDFCAQHNVTADIELITIDKIEEAYDRTVKSDVKYRFVIDIESIKPPAK